MKRIASVAPKAIRIETRPPSAVRVKRSRPNLSVPNGCWRLGVSFAIAKLISFGSYGEMIGTIRQ